MKGQISSVKGSLLPQFSKYALILNLSRCRNRIFDFDIAALDLVFFEWSSFPMPESGFPYTCHPFDLEI